MKMNELEPQSHRYLSLYSVFMSNRDKFREVENWYARRYPRLVAAQKENLRKLGKSDDYLELYGEVGERTE